MVIDCDKPENDLCVGLETEFCRVGGGFKNLNTVHSIQYTVSVTVSQPAWPVPGRVGFKNLQRFQKFMKRYIVKFVSSAILRLIIHIRNSGWLSLPKTLLEFF